MLKTYSFIEASPFLAFLDQNKEKILGERIVKYYSCVPFDGLSESPLVFELENFSIIVQYFFLSNLTITLADVNTVRNDLSLNFMYREEPWSKNCEDWVHEENAPFLGKKIADIEVERFSESFEINPSTGESRPRGGDYFSVITVILDDGDYFKICAAPTICDGYIECW